MDALTVLALMNALIALTSMNAPLALEYLVGHNRPRALSQTSNTKQPSDSLAKSTVGTRLNPGTSATQKTR